jgi:glycerol-3-phosphate O-acyltransferase
VSAQYIAEQKGVQKVKESLWTLARGSWSAFRRRYGRVWVSFGAAIVLRDDGSLPSSVGGEEGCRGPETGG